MLCCQEKLYLIKEPMSVEYEATDVTSIVKFQFSDEIVTDSTSLLQMPVQYVKISSLSPSPHKEHKSYSMYHTLYSYHQNPDIHISWMKRY